MNYYANQIKEVINSDDNSWVRIKIESDSSSGVKSNWLNIDKKYLVALHNDLLADNYDGVQE